MIAISRYAKWLDEEKRRETWDETVDRYFDFLVDEMKSQHEYEIPKEERDELSKAVKKLEILPSMRALRSAGPASKRDNSLLYNCSFVSVDSPRAFDETLYLLFSGVGVGFSVERQHVVQLPKINEHFEDSDTTIVVEDSKAGWAKGLRELVSLLISGQVPKWDLSKVRPAGSRLKTFGGRASGPEAWISVAEFFVKTFKRAAGRRLTSLECHDLMCKIGTVAVVGGSRRAALISLSNSSDDRMRDAKSGQWWLENPQRALANNSAVYSEKPELLSFMKEWTSLYKSKSGERGIFNRNAANRQVELTNRRKPIQDAGLNPCFPGRVKVIEKERGQIRLSELRIGDIIWSIDGWVTVLNKWSNGIKPIKLYRSATGLIISCTEDHKFVKASGEKAPIKDICLKSGKDKLLQVFDSDLNIIEDEITHTYPQKAEEVFDITVSGPSHTFWCNGFNVSNCAEIILRNNQFCNLSSVIVRETDRFSDIERKVRQATIIGTYQSALTNFKYLRKSWKNNCDEERLLGVSLSGILSRWKNVRGLEAELPIIKKLAVDINREYAEKIGIEQSKAVTCVKPDGNTSQLVNGPSGVHPEWSEYYIRTVRGSNKDPLTKLMIAEGVPYEPDLTAPNDAVVFSFPRKAPEGAVLRKDLTAIEHLNLWKAVQENWCEHNPSITVNIRDNEWFEVADWVWKNFDQVCGISFLPYADHTYEQAPYQEISKEKYEELIKQMPDINFDRLVEFEQDDQTVSSQQLACTGDVCELVKIGE